jgi:hypothetical protein
MSAYGWKTYIMAKSTVTYWNVLSPEHHHQWQAIPGLEGMAEDITLSIDPESGEYTRLTRFHPGADTAAWREKSCLPRGGLYCQWSIV